MAIDTEQGLTLKVLYETLGKIIEDLPVRADDPVTIKVGEEYFCINKNLNISNNSTISLSSRQLSSWKGEVTRQMNKIQQILQGKE